MKRYVCNVFTIAMAPAGGNLHWEQISPERAAEELVKHEHESAVGHEQTAKLASAALGIKIPFNRQSVRLEDGDQMVLCQYIGPRLPEGVTTLPEGAEIKWYLAWYRWAPEI